MPQYLLRFQRRIIEFCTIEVELPDLAAAQRHAADLSVAEAEFPTQYAWAMDHDLAGLPYCEEITEKETGAVHPFDALTDELAKGDAVEEKLDPGWEDEPTTPMEEIAKRDAELFGEQP